MIFGYHRVTMKWKQKFPGKGNEHTATYTVQTEHDAIRIQHLKEKVREQQLAYMDEVFQTALNQVRGTLVHAVQTIFTDNILKR